jgi:hypothetical protein
MNDLDQLKKEQEALRHWDARVRWKVIQETITWAEAQKTVRRNHSSTCLKLQADKLKS